MTAVLNSTMLCNTEPTVYSASHMACTINTPLLSTLFPGKSEISISRFLNASLAPGGTDAFTAAKMASGDNQVWAQFWHLSVEQFYCHASECTQAVSPGSNGVNASEWVCNTLQCTCRPGTWFCGSGSVNLTPTINNLAGPATVSCMGEGKCQFKQATLNGMFGPTGLTLDSCGIGECVRQYVVDQALGISVAKGDSGSLSGGVIAGLAVVGAILLLIVLTVIWGLIRRSKARKAAGEGSLFKHGAGVGVAWSGVGYEVQSHGRGLYGTVISWLRGTATPRRKKAQSEDGSRVGPNGGQVILRDVCGDLPPGGFCCILGPSGAGKSTLVDILAGKRKTGKVQGKVAYLNDLDRHVKVGYCDQSDVLAPTSTVFETLKFAACLRLPENVPKAVKEERARTVMHQLGLDHIADTRVGSGSHRGISGGEMRRVSIGIELVANPDVLVCDEPTSGLDSVSAARIVSLLKSLAEDPEQRTTVIASIHQPSSALYHSFSQVLLLAQGRQLYFGPGGNAPAEYFARQGRVCPPGYNVADHLLELASDSPENLLSGHGARSVHSSSSLNGNAPGPSKDDEKHDSLPRLSGAFSEVDLALASRTSEDNKWWPSPRCATTFLTQLEVISAREWRNLRRDKTLLFAHLLIASVLGVFAGGLYFQVDTTIGGFQNRVGSLFFLGALVAFSSLSALNNLSEIRPLFLRERSGSFYSPQAWLLSRVLWDIVPLRLLPTIILGVIVYFMVGLDAVASRFFKFLLILLEAQIFFSLYNFLLPSIFSHVGVATLFSSIWNLFNLVFAGFFINLNKIPAVLKWLHWIAPLSYTLEAMTVNEVGSGLMIVDVLNGVPINISAEVIQDTLFGFKMSAYYRDVLVLFGFIAGTGLLLIFTVVFFLRERR